MTWFLAFFEYGFTGLIGDFLEQFENRFELLVGKSGEN
jgi:hypothetical protein